MIDDSVAREKLWSMIKQYRFAMMSTRQADDTLRTRPMTTIERDADGSLWSALQAHPQVCLSRDGAEHRNVAMPSGAARQTP